MQQQRPHLRTVAATYAIGVGAATAASLLITPGDRVVAAVCAIGAVAATTMFRFLARLSSTVLTAAVLLALALPATADAHAYLVASTPANGASLARAPHTIDLRFTEAISASLTHVQIFDANGAERFGARVRSGAGPRELSVTLPKLPTGAYRVAYSTASQVDLHATRGAIVFGAGTAAPAITAAPSAAPRTDITETVAHVFDLLALSVLIAICTLLASGLSALVRARIARFALVALPALLLAGVLALAGKSSQFPLRDVLFNTAWGHAMLVRELAILAVLAAAATQRRRVALVLLVPVAVAEAASGHAASLDVVATLTMAAHILAAGVWVGGLIVLALVLPGLERRVVMDSLARFGRLAAAGVAVVVVTGLYSAGRQVASLDSLLTTTYGWSLVAKVALLGATGGLGLLGLMAVRRKRPSLLLLGAEALAAIGLLVAASVLLSSPPARGPQFAPAPPTIAGTTLATGQADDLLVDLSATPNRPGQNFVTVTLLDTRRPSPGTPRGVAFTFSRGTRTVTARARRLDPNRWQVAGTQLTEPGHWRIAVAVERTGLPRATYETAWTVATPLPAPGVHRARFSQRPIRPILTALAVALAAAAGVAVLWRRRQHFGIRRPRTA